MNELEIEEQGSGFGPWDWVKGCFMGDSCCRRKYMLVARALSALVSLNGLMIFTWSLCHTAVQVCYLSSVPVWALLQCWFPAQLQPCPLLAVETLDRCLDLLVGIGVCLVAVDLHGDHCLITLLGDPNCHPGTALPHLVQVWWGWASAAEASAIGCPSHPSSLSFRGKLALILV